MGGEGRAGGHTERQSLTPAAIPQHNTLARLNCPARPEHLTDNSLALLLHDNVE
jgi:hypothetical protein